MIIETHLELLRKTPILVATPMYGGMCTGDYTNALAALFQISGKYDLPVYFRYMVNESLIPRARNRLAHQFLTETNCSHLMFIDADIGFNPLDIFELALQSLGTPDRAVICGVYPKKGISWDRIKAAADKGLGNDDARQLAGLGASFPFDISKGSAKDFDIDKPNEVSYAGTGFMMIQRRVFEELAPLLSDRTYFDPRAGSDGEGDTVTSFFDCEIDETTRTYLSEDYTFCKRVREAGERIWICPWIRLSHVGTYAFTGGIADFAAAGLPIHKSE